MELEVGDVVMLKSGSARMTVAAIEGDMAACVWVDKGKSYRDRFELVTLKKYTSDGSGMYIGRVTRG
ncbi:MAG: DUF2158 domain-containing protein [Caulobacter sp.]|nr:DUF2158 domain-containing protein [Caulobacter sp.]